MAATTTSSAMAHITTLPNEILHHIFQWVLPADLASLPRVCRALYNFVNDNHRLFHDVYLHVLDQPPSGVDLEWETELHDLVKLQNICRRRQAAEKENEIAFVSKVVDRLLKHATSTGHDVQDVETQHASKNADLLRGIFKDDTNCVAFLQHSSLLEKVYKAHGRGHRREFTAENRLRSAKLHCLYGRPILNVGRPRSANTYPYACAKVYDMREYTDLTMWGPFMNDGTCRVDWEKVEAILIVLNNNVIVKRLSRFFDDIWDNPFSGSWPGSFKSLTKPELSSLDARDPYGVTGTWYRIVCFLDYNDFFTFNFPQTEIVPPDAPREPIYYGEATRLIIMRFHVTEIEEPGPGYHRDYPVVHFRGISRPLDDAWDDNANSDIRGMVGMTEEGELRWTTFSIFHGQERWKSEGIQIGGMRSARGVVGSWFDSEFDPHGPCGPTAFWKASDDENARDLRTTNHTTIPSDFLFWGTLIEMDEMIDSDGELDMDYTNEDDEEMGDDDDDDDDDDVQGVDDEVSESELVQNELPGRLLDAGLEVIDLTQDETEQSY